MSLMRRRLGKRLVTAEGVGSLTIPNLVSAYPKSLEICGRTFQDGIPTPENPVEIQYVHAGTIVTIQGPNGQTQTLTVPCDLYEGDIWRPLEGVVEKHKNRVEFDGTELWTFNGAYSTERRYNLYGVAGMPIEICPPSGDHLICTHTEYMIAGYNHNTSHVRAICGSNYAHIAFAHDGYLKGMDTEFLAWMVAESDAGRPVTVVFNMLETQIESTTPVPTHTYHGTNTITASGDGLLPGIRLTAYRGSVNTYTPIVTLPDIGLGWG